METMVIFVMVMYTSLSLLSVNNRCKWEVFIDVTRPCVRVTVVCFSTSRTLGGCGLKCYYEVNSSALCISWPWGESVSLCSSVWMNPKHLMQPLLCSTWHYITHTYCTATKHDIKQMIRGIMNEIIIDTPRSFSLALY